jgi:hypothetical protein
MRDARYEMNLCEVVFDDSINYTADDEKVKEILRMFFLLLAMRANQLTGVLIRGKSGEGIAK